MTSEQLLDLLAYLPDDAILRADPGHFRIRKKANLRKILTFGGLTAALVLCFTVGLTRFFSPTPGGSPSVQLPPVVATDTQTATTDTNSSTEDYENTFSAFPPPHFHYQGIGYSINGRWIVVESLPEGFFYIGEAITHIGCVTGLDHCNDDLYGNLVGSLYMNEEKTDAYLRFVDRTTGKTVYHWMEIAE